jgi:antitoxin component HigA of HigAB toxin-antitoxin module
MMICLFDMTAKELSNLTDESIKLIQKYMKEQNVTNHHLAKEAGVQATQLWLFLNKQRGLTNTSLEKIGKVIAQHQK